MNTTVEPSPDDIERLEGRCRRAAAKRRWSVRKIRPGSKWWAECGPYMVVDDHTTGVVSKGLDLGELVEFLDAGDPR